MSSSSNNLYIQTDCAVIGGGLAGCTTALELADAGKQVHLFVKGDLIKDCNSYLIAGGLAAVPLVDGRSTNGDQLDFHAEETLTAGKGLNDERIVRRCLSHFYPDVIQWLEAKGIRFDTGPDPQTYDLHREGGHSRSRIFHIKDATGIWIMQVLGGLVKKHPNIRVHENSIAIDLITQRKFQKTTSPDVCLGVYVYDAAQDCVKTVACQGVFVATGGLGKVFLYTTNSDVATGDGFAMCHRVGIPLVNMEFVQFHPSVFYDRTAGNEIERRFLLTEALRGEGAILKLHRDDSEDFVLNYDPLGSKATRDIITRAQDLEMRRHGLNHLWLDCTRIPKDRLQRDFKTSYDFCLSKGIDLAKEPVPIVYAVHYANGGVQVGDYGETELRGCYAIGEVSYTGLHGATRLASNSSPECVLYGRWAAQHFLSHMPASPCPSVPLWDVGRATELRDKTTVSYYWETIRRTMTALCGIARNEERLLAARELLASIRKSINELYWHYRVNKDFLEVRNVADVAAVIIDSAFVRKESRASHFREDFSEQDDEHFRALTVVTKGQPMLIKISGKQTK